MHDDLRVQAGMRDWLERDAQLRQPPGSRVTLLIPAMALIILWQHLFHRRQVACGPAIFERRLAPARRQTIIPTNRAMAPCKYALDRDNALANPGQISTTNLPTQRRTHHLAQLDWCYLIGQECQPPAHA